MTQALDLWLGTQRVLRGEHLSAVQGVPPLSGRRVPATTSSSGMGLQPSRRQGQQALKKSDQLAWGARCRRVQPVFFI